MNIKSRVQLFHTNIILYLPKLFKLVTKPSSLRPIGTCFLRQGAWDNPKACAILGHARLDLNHPLGVVKITICDGNRKQDFVALVPFTSKPIIEPREFEKLSPVYYTDKQRIKNNGKYKDFGGTTEYRDEFGFSFPGQYVADTPILTSCETFYPLLRSNTFLNSMPPGFDTRVKLDDWVPFQKDYFHDPELFSRGIRFLVNSLTSNGWVVTRVTDVSLNSTVVSSEVVDVVETREALKEDPGGDPINHFEDPVLNFMESVVSVKKETVVTESNTKEKPIEPTIGSGMYTIPYSGEYSLAKNVERWITHPEVIAAIEDHQNRGLLGYKPEF